MPKKRYNVGIADVRIVKSLIGSDHSDVYVTVISGQIYWTTWAGRPSKQRVMEAFNDDVQDGLLKRNWRRN